MPMFTYVAKDSNGNSKKEIVEALNEQVLVDRLQNEGYFVISVAPAMKDNRKTQGAKADTRKFKHNKCKLEDLLVLSRQLATLLESGVTLIRSLGVVVDQIESKQLHKIISEVKRDVEEGKTLSSSLAKYPKTFNQFWVSLVEVGEASGTMPMVLNKLAVHTEQTEAFRSTITSALVYPGVLFCVCMGAIAFFALFVAPRFESIFLSMKIELPALTKVLLAVFKFVKSYLLFIIAGIFVLVFLIRKYMETPPGRLMTETICFNLPQFGEIYKLVIVERFCSQLSILIDSGVPILYALEITGKLVENDTCAMVLGKVREDVREGKLLASTMNESGFFPSMAVQMIKVGEETGELGQMLKHVSSFYQKNVEAFMKRIGLLIEPLMLVFMGGIIGTIVLAMFLPMFDMTG